MGNAQSVGGFKVLNYSVKKAKETEKVKLVLEADVDEITTGPHSMGDFLQALLHHQTGETAVALRVFMNSSGQTDTSEE